MADVAREAGVSVAAVSYYFSGREEHSKRLSVEARQRIDGAVRSLGYVRNKTARHLRLQRTERICVLLPKLGIPFADKIIEDVDQVARLRGFMSIVVTGQTSAAFRQVASEVEAGLADGLIAEAEDFAPEELSTLFAPMIRSRKPCLILHSTAHSGQFSVLQQDRTKALAQALDHLLAHGHANIVYIRNQTGSLDARANLVQAFAAAHAERMNNPIFMFGGASRRHAASCAQNIARLSSRPSAVISESDFTAVTIIQEFHRLGLRVPEDVAVIGCGNAEEGWFHHPRLSTMGPEWQSLSEAAEHLFDLLQGHAVGPRAFSTQWKLLLRESG